MTTPNSIRRLARLIAVVALPGLSLVTGCVEHELTVNTEPQGALVYLNDQEVGRTPIKRDFMWYGTYDVVVRKEGYETLKTRAPVIAPWWQFVPFDLIVDILPIRVKDARHVSFTLKPQSEEAVDPVTLVGRGEVFRGQLETGEKNPSNGVISTTRSATTRPSK